MTVTIEALKKLSKELGGSNKTSTLDIHDGDFWALSASKNPKEEIYQAMKNKMGKAVRRGINFGSIPVIELSVADFLIAEILRVIYSNLSSGDAYFKGVRVKIKNEVS